MTSNTEVLWYKLLNKKDILELATTLSRHAIRAWNDFHLNSFSHHELKTLPERALREIESSLNGSSTHKIREYFTSFIPPVVHIRDGYLKYPYEVRLAFLSVFQILNGMVSTNATAAKEAFCSSIKKSIDAIKIAGILTTEEIELITNKYYQLSKTV